jgi:hypothetical protein
MSLFENDEYQWRETYFVMFAEKTRPKAEVVAKAIQELGQDYVLTDMRADEQGNCESFTLYSPRDYAAMDVSYVVGEEVTEQVEQLRKDLRSMPLTQEEQAKLKVLPRCTARFDVYHFEHIVGMEEEDEMLDPGSLLLVLERLGALCRGVAFDPQAGTVI